MLKTGHPIEPEELMAYLDGELDGERAALAAEHLERCAECRQVAEDFRRVSQSVVSWEVEEYSAEPPRARVRRRGWWWKAGSVAVAALGLVAVVAERRGATIRPSMAAGVLSRSANLQYETSTRVTPTLRSEGYNEQAGDITLRLIARATQLDIEVKDAARAREAMEAIVARHLGYIGNLTVRGDVTAQLQIPSAERLTTLAELKRLGRIVSESQSAEDFTRQSQDLDARLANTRITEQRLKEILQQRTGKLSEILEVEQQIARVRGEIEQMESLRKGLTSRVDYVAIAVTIREEVVGGSLGVAARNGWNNLINGLTGAATFVLEYGPSTLLWGALLSLPAWLLWRRRKKLG